MTVLNSGFTSLLALSSYTKASLAFTAYDKKLTLTRSTGVFNRYDSAGSTSVAAEREAFVSDLGSRSDFKSNSFSESDGESNLESNVNSNCDSNPDMDLRFIIDSMWPLSVSYTIHFGSATPLRLKAIYIKEAKILGLRRSY
ncbi:hypothetical protein QBC46DRAFT_413969 [Diplogelasinospora grovesii]|uniref:Uncharacterized protein n=1 Tax=Diplogelasinospora grovesii TaxID=303347 RepID=A0AAN6RYA8_9PEZI|nr:hypothetical protein QBC46DRAFT_413969 [Diplogelasinospora grovesii]